MSSIDNRGHFAVGRRTPRHIYAHIYTHMRADLYCGAGRYAGRSSRGLICAQEQCIAPGCYERSSRESIPPGK